MVKEVTGVERQIILDAVTFEHQADAVLTQANPVSATLYTVLGTTENVRIISLYAQVNWAVTQPDPLEIVVTIDGQTIIYSQSNPVSATPYEARRLPQNTAATQIMGPAGTYTSFYPFLLEGRSVKVEVRVTWAVTQPTPLVCRVKYAVRS